MFYKSLDINIYPQNSLTFLCLRKNWIWVQSFARSNLVESLDPVPDLQTFLQVIHIDIGVMAISIHTSWQELTSTLKAVMGEPWEGSYTSKVRLVASTELERLRLTGRCGATRGDREQKLNLTYCVINFPFNAPIMQNYPMKVITFKTVSPLRIQLWCLHSVSIGESWCKSFKSIEGTYSICPLIFRHCDFPWAPKTKQIYKTHTYSNFLFKPGISLDIFIYPTR